MATTLVEILNSGLNISPTITDSFLIIWLDSCENCEKEQYGDALDAYFRLGKNLNQRDTIAVRKMVGGYIKLLYPDGRFSKDEVEEVLQMALEMRRRVKEQLKS